MNETMRLKEMFPSYSLQKDRESTFYKPQRYQSIHSSQEDNLRLTAFRRSLQPYKQPESSNLLTRSLTSKKAVQHLTSNHDKTAQSQSPEKPIVIEADPLHMHRFAVALKSTNKQHKYEQIMESIEKKERQKSLQRSKTEPDEGLLERCLKSKKELFLNLPKIQFIELCK
jgi:hypothetical protein